MKLGKLGIFFKYKSNNAGGCQGAAEAPLCSRGCVLRPLIGADCVRCSEH